MKAPVTQPTPAGRPHPAVRLILVAILASAAASAAAQDTREQWPRPLAQYRRDVWQTQDGLPTNGIRALVQTRDGYLWAGSEAGLVRFDGVRFTTFDRNSAPPLQAPSVTSLFEDRNGTLWVGTDEGSIYRYVRGEFVDVAPTRRLRGPVRAFLQDKQGRLWVGGGDEVARLDGATLVSLGLAPGAIHVFWEHDDGRVLVGTSGAAASIGNGRLVTESSLPSGIQAVSRGRTRLSWLGTSSGLVRDAAGVRRLFTVADGLPSNDVRSLIVDRTGGLWVGTARRGLARFLDDRLIVSAANQGLETDTIAALLQDHEGNIWVGTQSSGLGKFRNVPFTALTRRQGLADDDVLAVYEDRLGRLWIGTDGAGLTVLRGRSHYTYTVDEGLPGNAVWSVAHTHDGAVWIGTGRGLARLSNGAVTNFTGRSEYPQGTIRALHEDRSGALWIGTRSGLHRLRNGVITTYTTAHGLASNDVSVIAEDGTGTLWIGTHNGGLNRFKSGRFTAYKVAQGLATNDVSAILFDGQYVWVGTLDGSLHLVRNDRALALPAPEGQSSGRVLQILDDGRGSLWVSGHRGIARFERGDLLKVANGIRQSTTPTVFDHRDGFDGWEFQGLSQAGLRRSDGRLLFASAMGVVVVDPSSFSRTLVAPQVHIEQVLADGKEVGMGSGLQLAHGLDRLEFRYTALSYSVPQRVRFRYQLEGLDSGWVDAGNRREATYTRVPGGRYRFRVIAANHDNIWNQQGVTLDLVVQSRFYETPWFYGLCGLVVVFGLAGVSRLRLRHLEARERVLEQIVDERTAELVQEVKERVRIEESLRTSRDELEDRVRERTTELSAAYAQLQRDVAERRRLEEQLAQIQKLESIGRLAGGVAHDINNVLTVVLSYSDLVDAGLGSQHPLQAQLGQIRKAAERASNLTHRLLAFARKQIIQPRVINATDLTLNLDGMLRGLIGEDIDLRTISQAKLWSVRADPHQLEQVLMNLAVNARDAMPNGGTLTIETTNVTVDATFARQHPELKPGDYVRLSVTDTGIGMDENVKQHLFEPFFTTKEPGRGTGLGLATSYGIIQQLGGVIYPDSEVGRGTTFNVFLPRVDLPAEVPTTPQPPRFKRGTETVLLVEDEPLVREIAMSALSDAGYRVLEAENGEEAVRLSEGYSGDIALVLTDVVMPRMGGRELIEELRRHRSQVRVLYMSGYAASTIDEQDVVEPGTAFLRKPFDLAEMLRKVREVLDAPSTDRSDTSAPAPVSAAAYEPPRTR
jgi:signal transduction histidine kinase/ligand-binding sensor domain-containing protein/CheY-like chemotaxis protein